MRWLVAATGLLLVLTACGGSAVGQAGTTTEGTTTAAMLTTAAPTPPATSDLDASAVVAALKAAGLPVTNSKNYTAADDPNNLLGRPGGYISKSAFIDRRLAGKDSTDQFSVDNGGTIEVYADVAGAKTRADYILSIAKTTPMLTEYVYQNGPLVLRLGAGLTPDQAKQYESTFMALASR